MKQGWSQLSLLTIESLSQTEDRLIWTAFSDDGTVLEDDIARRLFDLPARIEASGNLPECPVEMSLRTDESKKSILSEISLRNAQLFESEINKLESWSDDRKVMLEREIKEYDRRIKEARRSAIAAITLEDKLTVQKEVKSLEKERSEKRRVLFQAQDEIDAQRDRIIKDTEGRMNQQVDTSEVFCIRWKIA